MNDQTAGETLDSAMALTLDQPIGSFWKVSPLFLALGVVVAIIGVASRLAYANAVISQNSVAELQQIHADSRGYMMLARRLASGQSYVDDRVPRSREEGLVRPPIYPAFLALILKLGGGIPAIFIVQCLVGAAIPIMVMVIGYRIWGPNRAGIILAFIAGVASAASGTGIAISSVVLTDLLFSVLFLAGFVTLLYAAGNPKWISSAAAGVLFAMATLTKPTTVLWPIVSVLIWIALSRGRPLRLRNAAILVGVQLVLMGTWCLRNYEAENIFTFSGIAERNLRYEIAPIVEEWSHTDHFPTPGQIRTNYHRVEREAQPLLQQMDGGVGEYVRWERAGAMNIIQASPALTVGVIVANIYNEVTGGWRDFDRQLPRRGRIEQMGWLLDNVEYHEPWQFVWIGLTLIVVLIPTAREKGAARNWNFWAVVCLWITFVYFAALSGTTRDQGSRMLYPVEFARILLVIEAIRRFYELGKRLTAAGGQSPAPYGPRLEAGQP